LWLRCSPTAEPHTGYCGCLFLRDPKDHFVLELAVESRADFLLTFNARDFAGAERFGIQVITPREFLAIIGEAI